MERYIIHACPARMWYVEEYLVPSMIEQHIPRDDILIWCDADHKGCLQSAIDCFEHCGEHEGGCWHVQDDVIIALDFAKRTRATNDYIECGYCNFHFEQADKRSVENVGFVPAKYMWSSFPCIFIPNGLAGEFADWYYRKASYRTEYQMLIINKKGDDTFWRVFIDEEKPDEKVFNHVPALVDHIDWLIGGSVVNQHRGTNCRAYYWTDDNLIDNLKHKLCKEGHQNDVLF